MGFFRNNLKRENKPLKKTASNNVRENSKQTPTPKSNNVGKKILTKNEFRIDLNPAHQGDKKEQHPAYITARKGHKYRANTITHARSVDGVETLDVGENPNKKSKDKRKTRLSPPFWQNDKQFSAETLPNFRFSKESKRKIKKYNKKFK